MSEEHEAADSAAAVGLWEDFCESLKGAAYVLTREETPDDELDLVEGVRHLSRALRMGLEAIVEYGDPAFPVLFEAKDEATLSGGVAPDMTYHEAIIDGAHTYRIIGPMSSAPWLEIATYEGKPGMHDNAALVASITEERLEVASDGTLEVWIGGPPRDGNWLAAPSDEGLVTVRHVAHDWSRHTRPNLRIEVAGHAGEATPNVTFDRLRAGFERVARYVPALPMVWAGSAVDPALAFLANQVVNIDFDPDSELNLGRAQLHSAGAFDLEDGEALELRFRPADCGYWSAFLADYWFEPYQYRHRGGRSHLNDRDVVPEADGTVRLVIAARDPGVPNWLDTRDHRRGPIVFFWLRTREPLQPIGATKVRVADLNPA